MAGRLIRRHALDSAASHEIPAEMGEDKQQGPIDSDTLLQTLFTILLCLTGGLLLARALGGAAVTLPGFIWCLMIGVAIRNLEHPAAERLYDDYDRYQDSERVLPDAAVSSENGFEPETTD